MTKYFSIEVTHQPGAATTWTDSFYKAGINIEGFTGYFQDNKAWVYFVTSDYDKTVSTLKAGNYNWSEYDCFWINIPNEAGQLYKWSYAMQEAGVNIQTFFAVHNGFHIVSADNNTAAIEVAKQFGWYVEPVYS